MNNLFRATNIKSCPFESKYDSSCINNNYDYTENRGIVPPPPKNKKKKLDFKTMHKNTISSLNDVEYFLNNFNKISKYMKLFKFFR